MADIDTFLASYITTALWSSNDESDDRGGEPMDKHYNAEHLTEEARSAMRKDCEKFCALYGHLFVGRESDAGHDLWLTRNNHGAGFWDGDWSEKVGEELTRASKAFGEAYLFVGDDKRIHHESYKSPAP